jgi:hypothetical protein
MPALDNDAWSVQHGADEASGSDVEEEEEEG